MAWTVLFHDAFDAKFADLAEDLQDEFLAHARLLADSARIWGDRRWIPSKGHATPT